MENEKSFRESLKKDKREHEEAQLRDKKELILWLAWESLNRRLSIDEREEIEREYKESREEKEQVYQETRKEYKRRQWKARKQALYRELPFFKETLAVETEAAETETTEKEIERKAIEELEAAEEWVAEQGRLYEKKGAAEKDWAAKKKEAAEGRLATVEEETIETKDEEPARYAEAERNIEEEGKNNGERKHYP